MSKKLKAVITKIVIMLLLINSAVLGACQPTPTREAVVNAGHLEEAIARSSASVAACDAPQSWRETLDMKGDSHAQIEIDASISVPDVTAFPVYKVKKADFDTTQAKALVDDFTHGKEVIKDKARTKAELEEELVMAKKQNDEDSIAQLEEMIKTAPETVPDEVITDWNPVNKPSGCFADENGKSARISVMPDCFSYAKGTVIPESLLLSIGLDDPDEMQGKIEMGEVSISKEDAVAAAQSQLHGLGIDYMTASRLEKAFCSESLADIFIDSDNKPLSKGYLIKFVRNINGISGIINEGIILSVYDDFEYRAPLCAEAIQVYVNEAGQMQSFLWEYPLTVEEKVTENADLMPFEEMKQRIRDMLTFINSYNKEQIEVTSIELHMTIVDVKDNDVEAMYVPAWFINYKVIFDDSSQDNRFALNAIDGGRILETPVKFDPVIQQAMDADKKNLMNNQ